MPERQISAPSGLHKRARQYLCGTLWAKLLGLFLLFFCSPSRDVAMGQPVAILPAPLVAIFQCLWKGQKSL